MRASVLSWVLVFLHKVEEEILTTTAWILPQAIPYMCHSTLFYTYIFIYAVHTYLIALEFVWLFFLIFHSFSELLLLQIQTHILPPASPPPPLPLPPPPLPPLCHPPPPVPDGWLVWTLCVCF